jgi:hypothetical protein
LFVSSNKIHGKIMKEDALEQQKRSLLLEKAKILLDLQKPSNAKFFRLGKIQHQLHLIELEINRNIKNTIEEEDVSFGCNDCKHFDNCGLRIDYGSSIECDEKEV